MSFPETIKLIQFRAAYNLPVHAAIETGIFARHGLCVEVAYTPGSLYITQALNESRFDIGHTGADDIIAAVETDDRSDLFLFMGLHSGLFSVVGAPECPSIESLRGTSIGVDAKESGFVLVLENFLCSRGFTRNDYRLLEIGGWEERCNALLKTKIAATLLTEPFLGKALRAGCHLLGRDFEMIPVYQGTCGATTRGWAHRHPDRLRRYVRAYVEATQWCFAPPNRRLCLDILAKYHGIDGAGRMTHWRPFYIRSMVFIPRPPSTCQALTPPSRCEPRGVTCNLRFLQRVNMSTFPTIGKPRTSANSLSRAAEPSLDHEAFASAYVFAPLMLRSAY